MDATPPGVADDDIASLGVVDLATAYRQRRLSPVEVATALLDRLALAQAKVNAFVHVDAATTIAMARASETRWMAGASLGPLDGVPVTIKDLVAVAGWPLLRGSPSRLGDPPAKEDGACVARLREVGCVFLGKTATPDSGSRITTESPVHGVTLNPHDVTRTPGGSSGGAAAALAMGVGPLAVGTDGAGSIRIPAAWCGVVGHKPSFGRVPTAKFDIDMPFSVVGPMARFVDDAALMLAAMAMPDLRDAFAITAPFCLADAMRRDAVGLRVGITADFGNPTWPTDMSISDAVTTVAATLSDAGADVRPIAVQWPASPYETFMVFWEALYAGAMATVAAARQQKMDTNLLAIAERGRRFGAVDYLLATNDRLAIATAAHALFQDIDILIGPVMPCTAPKVNTNAPEGAEVGDWKWCPFTYLWNMTGQPAASVPVGYDAFGIPVGVQIVGRMGEDATVLRAAGTVERQLSLHGSGAALEF